MIQSNFAVNSIRIPVTPVEGPTLGKFSDPLSELPIKPKLLNIFPFLFNGDPEYIATEALKRDLSAVEKIRFDTVANICNSSCIFCYSKMKGEMIQILPITLEKILLRISSTCHRIVIGCGYEPLLAPNLTTYWEVIKKIVRGNFLTKPALSLTTNGLLLKKKNLDKLLPVLNWLHISIPSHRKVNYEKIMKGTHIESLFQGIQHIRNTYPSLRIHIEMVLTKINLLDVEDFLYWAFEDIGVSSLNIRRVNVTMQYHPDSYLAKSLSEGLPVGITDDEWKRVIERTRLWHPNITEVLNGDNNCPVSIIELTKK